MEQSITRERAYRQLQESAQVQLAVAKKCLDSILAAAAVIAQTFREDGKLLLCGNGGSAADCQHMAAELVSRLTKDFDRPGLAAIALTTDTSFLTAFGNDFGFNGVFERQVQALGKTGDTLLGISTSGASVNVIRAMEQARTMNMHTIALMGHSGPLADRAEVAICIPSSNTQHIQEACLVIEHILCDVVERELYPPLVLNYERQSELP